MKNMTMFRHDLHHKKLPQWMYITPNMSKFLSNMAVQTYDLLILI